MKQRYVFQTSDVGQAQQALRAALDSGIADDDAYLVARSDIEVRHIHSRRQMADSNFIPAAIRGAAIGAVLGLLALLAFAWFWSWSLGFWGVLLGIGVGAAIGAFASSLVGAANPDPIRRHFEEQIEGGSVLVVIDADGDAAPAAITTIEATGATLLPYEAPASMT